MYNNLNPTISHSSLPTVISCKAPEAAVEKSRKRVVKVFLFLYSKSVTRWKHTKKFTKTRRRLQKKNTHKNARREFNTMKFYMKQYAALEDLYNT